MDILGGRRPRVVGIGEVLWDILPSGPQLGGAPANFAFHAKAMGADAAMVSRVGKDALGVEILNRFDAWGVDRSAVTVDPEHASGTVSVTLGPGGSPCYVIHEPVAWDYITLNDAALSAAGAADAACFGTLCQRSETSRGAIRRFLDATSPRCLRVFDINLRLPRPAPEVILESLEIASVLKLNDEELPEVAALCGVEGDDREMLAGLCVRFRLHAAALTRGPRGSLLWVDGLFHDHPGYPVEVVDSIGAGDAFTAALTIGLLENAPPAEINDRANRVAAAVCAREGGMPARAVF